MKKIHFLKSWMLMVLAAGFVMAGCSSDDDPQPPIDNRGDVVGTYPVKITLSGPMNTEIDADLTLAKEGDGDLKASATVTTPTMGSISINLVLSSLDEYTPGTRAIPTGYNFKIAEQNISVFGEPVPFKGTGKNGNYDGKVYKTGAESFVSFEVENAENNVTMKVESVTAPAADNRADVVGGYPVKVTVGGSLVGDGMVLYTDLTLAKEGDEDLKGSAAVSVPVLGDLNINLVLSSLEEYDPESRALPTGFNFKIAEQDVDAFGTPMKFKGAGLYGDYDGKVYKTASESNISFEITGPGGAVTVKVESWVEDNRDDVVGTYPVKVTVGGMVDMVLYADLTLAKEGDADLKGSAAVVVPEMGNLNIDLVFSSLEEYDPESRALPIGFNFKIAEQTLDAFGMPMAFKGAGLYGDYDGKVYKTASESDISFEITGAAGAVTVKVESGELVSVPDRR